MKKIAAILLCSIPVLMAFTNKETDRKSLPDCYIQYSQPDASLKISEAKIQFTFSSDYFGTVKDSVIISYNGVSKTLHCDTLGHASIIVKPSKYKFQFWLNNRHREIYTDSLEMKAGNITGVVVTFRNSFEMIEADKPVIYFYPTDTTSVNVKLRVNGNLGFTYPAYNGGWNFTAHPDGKLISAGKEYHYLFWEANVFVENPQEQSSTGFIVNSDSLVSFLEEKLSAMGLNSREQNDFITYWCPLMSKNEKNYVHFMFNEEYDNIASIQITPKPDHIFRVFMTWQDASDRNFPYLQKQEIPHVIREGFTVVEWGGGEINMQLGL